MFPSDVCPRISSVRGNSDYQVGTVCVTDDTRMTHDDDRTLGPSVSVENRTDDSPRVTVRRPRFLRSWDEKVSMT